MALLLPALPLLVEVTLELEVWLQPGLCRKYDRCAKGFVGLKTQYKINFYDDLEEKTSLRQGLHSKQCFLTKSYLGYLVLFFSEPPMEGVERMGRRSCEVWSFLTAPRAMITSVFG